MITKEELHTLSEALKYGQQARPRSPLFRRAMAIVERLEAQQAQAEPVATAHSWYCPVSDDYISNSGKVAFAGRVDGHWTEAFTVPLYTHPQQADITKLIEAGDAMQGLMDGRPVGQEHVDASMAWDSAKTAVPAQQPKRLTDEEIERIAELHFEEEVKTMEAGGEDADGDPVIHRAFKGAMVKSHADAIRYARDHGYLGGLSVEDVREVLRDWYKGLSEPQEAEFIDRLTAKAQQPS